MGFWVRFEELDLKSISYLQETKDFSNLEKRVSSDGFRVATWSFVDLSSEDLS